MNEAEKLINSLYGKGTIGFTCDSCGREVNGCSIVNGMTFCAKCYQETFGKDNQQNEIQQLKQQLEEKDEQIKKRVMVYEEQFIEQTNEIYSLKQQLAEKDKEIEEILSSKKHFKTCAENMSDVLKTINSVLPKPQENGLNYKKVADDVIALIKEKDKEINSLIVDYEKRISQEQELMSNMEHRLAEKQNTINEINKEFVQAVHDWKALCAEKDKEIETMKKDSDKNIDYLVEFASLIENEKDCNRMLKALDRVKSGNKYIIDKANQSKTEFAIQELEKVKELVKDKSAWSSPFGLLKIQESDVEQIIDQQIKELKGE